MRLESCCEWKRWSKNQKEINALLRKRPTTDLHAIFDRDLSELPPQKMFCCCFVCWNSYILTYLLLYQTFQIFDDGNKHDMRRTNSITFRFLQLKIMPTYSALPNKQPFTFILFENFFSPVSPYLGNYVCANYFWKGFLLYLFTGFLY